MVKKCKNKINKLSNKCKNKMKQLMNLIKMLKIIFWNNNLRKL